MLLYLWVRFELFFVLFRMEEFFYFLAEDGDFLPEFIVLSLKVCTDALELFFGEVLQALLNMFSLDDT